MREIKERRKEGRIEERKEFKTRHVLIRPLDIVQRETLPAVHHGFNTVRINRPVHLLEHHPTAHVDAPHNTAPAQALQKARLLLLRRRWPAAAYESNDRDAAVHFDGFERLRHRLRSPNFDDVVDAQAAGRQLGGGGAPVWLGVVVDDVVGAEMGEESGFGV